MEGEPKQKMTVEQTEETLNLAREDLKKLEGQLEQTQKDIESTRRLIDVAEKQLEDLKGQ